MRRTAGARRAPRRLLTVHAARPQPSLAQGPVLAGFCRREAWWSGPSNAESRPKPQECPRLTTDRKRRSLSLSLEMMPCPRVTPSRRHYYPSEDFISVMFFSVEFIDCLGFFIHLKSFSSLFSKDSRQVSASQVSQIKYPRIKPQRWLKEVANVSGSGQGPWIWVRASAASVTRNMHWIVENFLFYDQGRNTGSALKITFSLK